MTTRKIERPQQAWVKPLSDYGPLVVFFVAYNVWNLYVATAALMAATGVALALSLAINRRMPLMPLITAAVVGVFGGLTLVLKDDTFIKMKPTIVQAVIGAILLGGLMFGKTYLKPVLGSAWPMNEEGWRKVTRNFGLFFLAMAVLNEVVWRTQSEDFWVNFKVFGIMALTVAFSLTQVPLLNRHRTDEEGDGGEDGC